MPKKQITLADLAKSLGISTATVSRALKNYPDISKETKRRVLELAKEMNYRPNSMAAGLRKRESNIIGVIVPSIVNHFFSSVIKGIMEVAYQQNFRVMLCQSNESHDKEVADANALFGSRVDGVMISLAHETQSIEHLKIFQDAGVPLVFFDKTPEGMPNISRVVVDDYQGAFQAVDHLIRKGHHRIAHFRGPLEASTSRNRLKGYKDALKSHDIPFDENLIYPCKDISLEEGKKFAISLHKNHPDCTALFTITDLVAIGAMLAFRELGIHVPNQMAICGFSNNPMASIIQPSLSSVSQPSLEMGRKAAHLLLKEIQAGREEQDFHPKTITLNTKLTVRDSSAHQISLPHVN